MPLNFKKLYNKPLKSVKNRFKFQIINSFLIIIIDNHLLDYNTVFAIYFESEIKKRGQKF